MVSSLVNLVNLVIIKTHVTLLKNLMEGDLQTKRNNAKVKIYEGVDGSANSK